MYLAMTKQADLVSPLSVEKRKGGKGGREREGKRRAERE